MRAMVCLHSTRVASISALGRLSKEALTRRNMTKPECLLPPQTIRSVSTRPTIATLVSAVGARWDIQSGTIVEARLKELTSVMPVIFAKAVPMDRQDTKHTYECPVYKTKRRGPNYVWTFRLKSKEKTAKWVLAGVALLLEA